MRRLIMRRLIAPMLLLCLGLGSLARADVAIDAAYLGAHPERPLVLDQSTTYRLLEDLRADGTAFVFGAAGVTLDLAGHTVTYGDAPPPVVANGGFEAEPTAEAPVPGWDFLGAAQSTFAVAPNDSYMAGSRVLRWAIPHGAPPQSIRSAPIAVEPGLCYTASCLSSGLATARNYSTRVDVLDAVTGLVVADRTSYFGQAAFGEGGVTTFHAGTASAVVLSLTIVPSTSGTATTTALLDDVRLTRSNEYGVLASRASQSRLSGVTFTAEAKGDNKKYSGAANLPPAALAAYGKASSPSVVDTVGGGAIRQGRGAGHYSHALMLNNCPGTITVRGITTIQTGPDTSGLSAAEAGFGGSVDVQLCTFGYDPDVDHQVTVRQALVPAINTKGSGPATVRGCTIANNPHVGIQCGSTLDGADCTVAENVITPRTKATNGYAIYPHGHGVAIQGNTITGYTRGLMLESDPKTVHLRWTISGNRVDVRELGNREYRLTALCRALRVRNGAADSGWFGLVIEDNEFTARTEKGLQLEAHGGRFALVGRPEMNDSKMIIRRNLFRGIVEGATDPGPDYKAEGLTLENVDPDIKPTFLDNRIESTGAGLVLCGGDSTKLPVADVSFERTSIKAPTPIKAGIFGCPVERITFVGLDTPADAGDPFRWDGTGNKDLAVSQMMTVNVWTGDDLTPQVIAVPLPPTTYRGAGIPKIASRKPRRVTIDLAP